MKKRMKRAFALVLVLTSVLSWIVPVSAVDPASVTYNIGHCPVGASGNIDAEDIAASKAQYNSGNSNFALENLGFSTDSSLKYYGNNMIKVFGRVGDYMLYRIQSPGSGVHSLTLKHGTFFRDGVASVYVLPVSTQDIGAALIPANRVGKVDMYNENTNATTDFSPNHQTVVGNWEFGTDAEYFVVIQCSDPTPIDAKMCYMQIYSLTVTKGELPVPVPAQREKSMTVTESPIKTFEAATYAATGEINGQAHLFLPIEGKKLFIYNLETGEKFDEVDIRFNVTRGTAVDPDGKFWFVGSTYYLQCYDPATKTLTDYTGFKTAENAMSSGFDLIYAPNGCLYFGAYSNAHVFEFNIATETFRDMGNHNPDASYACGIAYDPDGYIYAGLVGNKNSDDVHTREVVKIRIEDGACVGRTDVSECVNKKEIMIRGAALCGDIYIAGGIEMDKMLAIDTKTMTLTTLSCDGTVITNPINFSVSEEYNGKHYFSLRANGYNYVDNKDGTYSGVKGSVRAGLYAIEDATGEVEFVSSAMTTTMKFSTDSITGLNGKAHLMWPSGMNVRCIDLETKEVTTVSIPASNTDGASVSINSLGLGVPGTGDIHIGAFNNDKCSTFNVNTGEISGNFYTNGQTDCMITYQNKLFVGNYKDGVLVQVDTKDKANNKVLLDFRYTNDPEGNPFSQVRVHALAAGDNKVFAGTIPDSYLRGGCIGWYDLKTGESYIERNVVENQSINSLAYHDGYLYGTTTTAGGTGAGDDTSLSAKLFIYDVANKRKVKEIDLRDVFEGMPKRLSYLSGIVEDPNIATNGKIWGIAAEVLFSFTFDKNTETASFQEELVVSKTKFAGGGSKRRDICFQDGYIYTYFSGSAKFCKINYNDPTQYTTLPVAKPSHFVIGEDKNLYYVNDSTLYMYPLDVTEEDRAAAMAVDTAIIALNKSVTLQDKAAIEAARNAYDALQWDQKALISCLYLLEEAEAALLEVRIDGLDLRNPDQATVNELMRLYDAMTNTQKGYVGNYEKLNQAKAVLSGSIYGIGTQVYATLGEALTNATAGTVIKLLTDREEDDVEITRGAILDLNGYTLVCDSMDTTAVGNGHVIDSQSGKGLLMVSDLILLREDNLQMPLLDRASEGYRFFEYTFCVDTDIEKDTSGIKVWYRMEFTEASAYTLLANNACDLEIGAEVKWNGEHLVTAVFGRGDPLSTDAFSSQWAQAMQDSEDIWLFIRINGLQQFGVNGELEVIPLVKCCGVKAQTTGQSSVTYQIKGIDYGYTERG